jgi:hypothetical protein
VVLAAPAAITPAAQQMAMSVGVLSLAAAVVVAAAVACRVRRTGTAPKAAQLVLQWVVLLV